MEGSEAPKTGSVDVGAALHKRPHRLRVAILRSKVQRRHPIRLGLVGLCPGCQQRSNNGGMEIDVFVQRAIAKDMARNGPITQAMGSMFGLSRAV